MEWFERRGACGQSFAIARELKTGVDSDSPNVGEVVDVQARKVTSLLRRTQCAKRRLQLFIDRRLLAHGWRAQVLETWPFGKICAPDDTKRQGRIAVLQEANCRLHRVDVTPGMLKKVSD